MYNISELTALGQQQYFSDVTLIFLGLCTHREIARQKKLRREAAS